MRLKQIFLICGGLVAVALSLFCYKAFVLHFPVMPNEEAQSWVVEAKLRFDPDAKTPLRARLFMPQSGGRLALVHDNIIAPDYGISKKIGKATGNHSVELTRRAARGQQVLFYQAVFYELKASDAAAFAETPQAQPVYVPKLPSDADAQTSPLDVAMLALIADAQNKSADNASFALELVKLLKRSDDDRVAVVTSNLPQAGNLAARTSALANAAEVPARIVNGVALSRKKNSGDFIQWLEVFQNGAWQAVDVDADKIGVPDNYLAWWRGAAGLARVTGGHDAAIELSVKYNREDAITQARWKSRQASKWIEELSLFDLPLDTQIMFGIVLMIPIGALVIVVLRQMVGLKTFGTFMPVLIALSFRETGILWGIALFGLIVVIGLYLRAYFDSLRLLVVPRLASVLTIVVLLIAVLTVISYKLGINAGLSITLFPMIILTMTIERMALTTEEFGAKEARKTAYGSLLAATLAYFAMHNPVVEHLVFVFPELLLIVLACTILLGRYNGYKFSEYRRFKKLAKAIEANNAGVGGP